jgi:hypothetical protein
MERMTRSMWIGILWFAALAPRALAQSHAPEPRQVAAPASDIVSGIVRLPDPASTPIVSRAAILPLAFTRATDSTWSARVELPIDRGGDVALGLLSHDAGTWTLDVESVSSAAIERRVAPVGDDMPGWVVARHDLRGATAGRWTIHVRAPSSPRPPASGWLLARTSSDLELSAHVTTLQTLADEPIGIAARVDDGSARVDRMRLIVETAHGTSTLPMRDDGKHADGAGADGVFGAWIETGAPGDVRARVECSGTTRDGAAFLRTAQLAFPVLERALAIDGSARGHLSGDGRLRIEMRALPLSARASFHVSAEVWGRSIDGARIPVCWLSRQIDPARQDGLWVLPLDLDLRWLDVTQARAPLELRQVRVQDPDSETVIDFVDHLALEVPALPALARGGGSIASEMLTGGTAITASAPAHTPLGVQPKPRVPSLMLVHGYCSGGSIWPPADFTQPKIVFLDPNQNRTHDQFAQRMYQTAFAAGVNSFGIVAHSQGGAAALQLLTYYHSPLDFSVGGRRIQSVATPYQGTPLASLGAFACGVNNNMTPAGSATWLAGIPSWARAEVFFWTTSNSGSACQFLTDFFLTNPEDGTVEQFRGQLPGGNGMGHVTGWCHTTGMSNSANYTDHARNLAMDAAASR